MSTEITSDYLKSLNKPYEAINSELWEEITDKIRRKMEDSTEFNYICSQNINKIAPNFGLIWNNIGESNPSIDYINYSFDQFYNMKNVSVWFKKSLCLSIYSLYEIENPLEIKDLYNKVYKHSAKQLKKLEFEPLYHDIRVDINKFLKMQKKNITDETYDIIYIQFIKLVIKLLLVNGDFNTKDIPKYINVLYARFVKCLEFKDIGETLGYSNNEEDSNGGLSTIVFKFVSEFKNAYSKREQIELLCNRFEKFYDTALNILNTDDYETRNKRLKGIKLFQKYFITGELASYIPAA